MFYNTFGFQGKKGFLTSITNSQDTSALNIQSEIGLEEAFTEIILLDIAKNNY